MQLENYLSAMIFNGRCIPILYFVLQRQILAVDFQEERINQFRYYYLFKMKIVKLSNSLHLYTLGDSVSL